MTGERSESTGVLTVPWCRVTSTGHNDNMPLYEYECTTCSARFEFLVRANDVPQCPSCGETKLEKRFSVFAARTNGIAREASIPACGRCGDPRGPGSCAN